MHYDGKAAKKNSQITKGRHSPFSSEATLSSLMKCWSKIQVAHDNRIACVHKKQ